MRGVPVDLSDRPILKRVVAVAIANMAVAVLVMALGIGRSRVEDSRHTLPMRAEGRTQDWRPAAVRYVQGSLLFFIGTMFYIAAKARRDG